MENSSKFDSSHQYNEERSRPHNDVRSTVNQWMESSLNSPIYRPGREVRVNINDVHQELQNRSSSPQPGCSRSIGSDESFHDEMVPPDQPFHSSDEEKSEKAINDITPNRSGSLKCQICSKILGWLQKLANHLQTHSDEKSFQCETCGKSLKLKKTLEVHKRTHTKPLKCKVCGKGFAQRQHLKNHMLAHTGAQPFKCQLCGLSLTTDQSLQYHINTHTGAKPYAGENCHKRFAQLSGLSSHRKQLHFPTTHKC